MNKTYYFLPSISLYLVFQYLLEYILSKISFVSLGVTFYIIITKMISNEVYLFGISSH